MNDYDQSYNQSSEFFGADSDLLLKENYALINTNGKVLDLGSGQGRNAFFLSEKGYRLDCVEPSLIAVNQLKKNLKSKQQKINIYQLDFDHFNFQQNYYHAVLIFGLIQILSVKQIENLISKVSFSLISGGKVFISGFTKQEQVFKPQGNQWEKISDHSFINEENDYRTFLNVNEVLNIFKGFRTLFSFEGLGPVHRHGNGKPEQHHQFSLILEK